MSLPPASPELSRASRELTVRSAELNGKRSLAGALITLARTTLVESLQQPALLLLTCSGVLATALIPLLQFHQFGEAGRLARDGALAYQLTIGLAIAVIAASAAIYQEIISGTASAALSKPLSRNCFILGKFGGVAALVTQFWYILLVTMLLAERIAHRINNYPAGYFEGSDSRLQAWLLLVIPATLALAGWLHYRRRFRFCLSVHYLLILGLTLGLLYATLFNRAGDWLPACANLDWRIMRAALPILALLILFSAFATACATRLRAALSMTLTGLILLFGLASETLTRPTMPLLVRLPARLLPNIQAFWLCDALTGHGTIAWRYLALLALYTLAATTAALALAMLAFRSRDIN